MNFRDMQITCNECGKEFFFTVEAQRRMADQGQEIVPPELCPQCTQQVKYSGKLHGRVKWYDPGKGYGFIAGDDGNEIFVHRSGVPLTEGTETPVLEEGQEVLYEVQDTPKGPQAVHVEGYGG